MEPHPRQCPELPPEHVHVGAETGELAADRQGRVGGDVEPVRLAADVTVLQVEDLGEGDRLVVTLVGEDAEQDAELRGVPQRDGAGPASDLVPLGLVVAEHVGAQRPLAGLAPAALL